MYYYFYLFIYFKLINCLDISLFQLLSCKDSLLFFVLCDWKLNICGLRRVGETKQRCRDDKRSIFVPFYGLNTDQVLL